MACERPTHSQAPAACTQRLRNQLLALKGCGTNSLLAWSVRLLIMEYAQTAPLLDCCIALILALTAARVAKQARHKVAEASDSSSPLSKFTIFLA